MPATLTFWNRKAPSAADFFNRGLAYGDGVFETIRFDGSTPLLWHTHLQRLFAGAEMLGLAPRWKAGCYPEELLAFLRQAIVGRGWAHTLVNVYWVRGHGQAAAGYSPDPSVLSNEGLLLRACDALPEQPNALPVSIHRVPLQADPFPSIKHLNRLPQVMAALDLQRMGRDNASPDAQTVSDLLLLDERGFLVEATASNVFYRMEGRWYTPPIVDCGIAGTLRSALLQAASAGCERAPSGLPRVQVRAVHRSEFAEVEAMALGNSVRGIRPVSLLDGRACDSGLARQELQRPVYQWLTGNSGSSLDEAYIWQHAIPAAASSLPE